MTPEELIEAVSKMTEGDIVWHRMYDSRSYLIGWRAELCHGDRTALDCLRNHAVRLLQSLISERDAALARVAELEGDAGRYRAIRQCVEGDVDELPQWLYDALHCSGDPEELDIRIDAAINSAKLEFK